jgi:hypothetical protein
MGRHATTPLPVTGIEVLQLALLVIALFLVGARLRVRALQRKRVPAKPSRRGPAESSRRGPAESSRRGPAEPSLRGADPAYAEDFAAPISARRTAAVAPRRTERRGGPARRAPAEGDEWPFPDPDAPLPTALLPSTATARRRAREFAMSDDRR